MSRNLGTIDAPLAARAERPGWRDPRLWIGVALVAASVLAGARLLGGADNTIEVWAADVELAAGQPVSEADLVVRRVRFADDGAADRYLKVGDDLPDEATLGRVIGAGELLPVAALDEPAEERLQVPIWAPDVAVPDGVRPGTVVDVWVTPASDAGRSSAVRVLDDVVVIAVPRDSGSFAPGGDRQVVVGVDPERALGVGRALAAAKDNRVALTVEG